MEVRDIILEKLIPSRNLRTENPVDVSELAASIREHGLLQPIRVRPLQSGNYQIIAGHRRVLAFRTLGLKAIPASVVEESEQVAAVQSIVENLQREDLTPLELARGIQQLVVGYQMNIDTISRLISKSLDRIKTWIRIAGLPDAVLSKLESGEKLGTQRVTGLTPRHIEPFIRDLPTEEERMRNKEAASRFEERVSEVGEFVQEYERRGTRINAHMADAIAREARQGDMTVAEAMNKVLSDPDRYRYKLAPEEIEADTFTDFRKIHYDLIALANKLKPYIAVSFSPEKKKVLLESLDSLNEALDPYRQALMYNGKAPKEKPAQLPKG